MERPSIVLKLKVKQFRAILSLAESVYENLNGNIHFVSPAVSLPHLNDGIIQLTNCIAKWGPEGNRGSHLDHVNLEVAALRLYQLLKSMAAYCESTVRQNLPVGDQESVMATSGFARKKARTPQGRLEMVQNFRHFIARNVRQGHVKLRWEQPLRVTTFTNVKSYDVYRNTTNDFAAATIIKTVTATTYTDAPVAGIWFYWVVPFNCMGRGVTSHAVQVQTV